MSTTEALNEFASNMAECRKNSDELHRAYMEYVNNGGMSVFLEWVRSNLGPQGIDPRRQSIRRLFELMVKGGDGLLANWEPDCEAASFEAMRDFSALIGQFIWHETQQAYNSHVFELSKIVQTEHTDLGSGNGWETSVRGVILDLDHSTIFFDGMGGLMDRAASIGRAIGMSKEARLRDHYLVRSEGARYRTESDLPWGPEANVCHIDWLVYMENWPLSLVEMPGWPKSPPGWPEETPRGTTVCRWKASERGGVRVI